MDDAIDKDMIAARLGPKLRMAAVASPAYFAKVLLHGIRGSCSHTTSSTSACRARWPLRLGVRASRKAAERASTGNSSSTLQFPSWILRWNGWASHSCRKISLRPILRQGGSCGCWMTGVRRFLATTSTTPAGARPRIRSRWCLTPCVSRKIYGRSADGSCHWQRGQDRPAQRALARRWRRSAGESRLTSVCAELARLAADPGNSLIQLAPLVASQSGGSDSDADSRRTDERDGLAAASWILRPAPEARAFVRRRPSTRYKSAGGVLKDRDPDAGGDVAVWPKAPHQRWVPPGDRRAAVAACDAPGRCVGLRLRAIGRRGRRNPACSVSSC